jgi:UDP-N-acetylmuramate--alanine ligase
LLDIYAAAEQPIPGVTSAVLYEGIRGHGHREVYYLQEWTEVVPFVRRLVRENDILMTLGAGNVWRLGEAFLARHEEV